MPLRYSIYVVFLNFKIKQTYLSGTVKFRISGYPDISYLFQKNPLASIDEKSRFNVCLFLNSFILQSFMPYIVDNV